MRDDIISDIQKDIKIRCESPNNFFGIGVYYHIEAVVKNAIFLAEKYNADTEVVTIAAWLHDYASVIDYKYYNEHHIWGAKMAKELLEQFDYPLMKIELVQNCILNHRGSTIRDKRSAEEICVADADAISHFDTIPSLFYLAYVKRKYSIEEGIDFVENKLTRSFNKMSEESKLIYMDKYNNALKVINKK